MGRHRMTEMTLYTWKHSMAAYRVRVALGLKGITANEIEVDLDASEQFNPDFLETNPEGAVPALVDSGNTITQSLAILEYIDERFETPPLLPDDPAGRARVRALSHLIVSDTHPLITHRVGKQFAIADADPASWRNWCIHWLDRGLKAFEARLVNDPRTGLFCHGDSVTIADICLASLVLLLEHRGYSTHNFPAVSRVIDTCRTLPPFVDVIPSESQ